MIEQVGIHGSFTMPYAGKSIDYRTRLGLIHSILGPLTHYMMDLDIRVRIEILIIVLNFI